MNKPDQISDESSIRYPGWRVVGVCFVVAAFAWALGFYGQSVYVAELHRIHGWPTSQISTATSFYYLFSSMLVVFVSEAMRKLGPRGLLLAGVVCLAAASLLIGRVSAIWQLYLAYALLAFGWAGTTLASINNTLGMWFEKRRGLAISLSLNGASIGGVIGVPLLAAATGAYGFASALAMGAALTLLIAIPVIVIYVGQPPARQTLPSDAFSEPAEAALSPAKIRRAAFSDVSFWTIVVPFALVLVAQVAFIVHVITFLDPLIGRERASIAVALMTAMAVVGRVLLGTVIDRMNQRSAAAVLFVSQALALCVLVNTSNEATMFACCAVFGFTVGNAITLPSLIVQREFDARSFGVLVSLVTALSQFTYAFGPGLVGWLRDLSGSYTLPFYVCAALEVVGAALVLIRRKSI